MTKPIIDWHAPRRRQNKEHQEQASLIRWAQMLEQRYPELMLLHAIPNGGHRHIAVALKMKAEGIKAGVPDLFLACPIRPYHGLYIEMKVPGNKLTEKQEWWREALERQQLQLG